MKKSSLLAMAAFSLFAYPMFAEEPEETEETVAVETEEITVSLNGDEENENGGAYLALSDDEEEADSYLALSDDEETNGAYLALADDEEEEDTASA